MISNSSPVASFALSDTERHPVPEIRQWWRETHPRPCIRRACREAPARRRAERRSHSDPAQWIRRRHRIEHLDHFAVDAEIMRAIMRRDRTLHEIRKPDGLEYPQRFMIERNRARLVVNTGGAFNDRDPESVRRQQVGEDGANRSVADDRHIIVWDLAQRARSLRTWRTSSAVRSKCAVISRAAASASRATTASIRARCSFSRFSPLMPALRPTCR